MIPKIGKKKKTLDDLTSLFSAAALTFLAVVFVATLFYGRQIFVPMALAILLSFVVAPPVGLLQRFRVPRAGAVVGVVLFAFAVIFGLASLIAAQLTQLAGDLPRYQSTMQAKIHSVRGISGSHGTLERAAVILQHLSEEIDRPKDADALLVAPPSLSRPAGRVAVPVELRQPDPGALENLRSLIAPLVSPLATTGIIIIFVIFILLQREDLRNRLIRLAGSSDLQRTTAAMDDAAARLSRLFLTQLVVNACFGVAIGAGLWFIGIPGAVLWGILAMVLRFVPYIGQVISAAFPLALAMAVDPGWSMLIWTAALFVVVGPVVGQGIEPLVYGRSTGLSPVAVVVSATFWTALWGPIGLVLATPLTVCLVVLGRHVERLAFLDVMLGDRPALSPPEIFYQRMLAGDPTEAAEKAEEFLKEGSLSSYYDDIALKGLQLAQADLDREVLDAARLLKIRDTVGEFANDLSDQDDREPPSGHSTLDAEAAAALEGVRPTALLAPLGVLEASQLRLQWQTAEPVLCLAGRTPLDEAVGIMFAHLATAHGLKTRVEGAESLSRLNIFQLQTSGVAMVCLSYLDVSRPAHIRFAVRRIRRKLPEAIIMVACWSPSSELIDLEQICLSAKADLVVGTLRDAIMACIDAGRAPATETQAAHLAPLATEPAGQLQQPLMTSHDPPTIHEDELDR